MDTILSFVKSFFILSVLLLILSYLAPNENYKRYFQYFLGIWICALLLQPVAVWFTGGEDLLYQSFAELEEQMADIEEWQQEGVNIFELFGVDTEED